MATIIDLGSAANDDHIYSDGLQVHSSPESAPSTDEAPPQAVTSPSVPKAVPPVSPAPRFWHQFCNRTLHIPAIPDVPTPLPSRESDD